MTRTPDPLFSVIIPTYNRADKIVRAVKSVLAQTLGDYDVWVIDDGSTDHTQEALASYQDRIHYINVPNGGLARARNKGIHQSTGRYVAFLDDDDWWRPQKLELIARAIREHPLAGLLYSHFEKVDEAGRVLWADPSRPVNGSAYLPLLMGNFIAASSVVIRRSALAEDELFDPTLSHCEDWDLWLRVARQHPVILVPAVLVEIESAPRNKMTSSTQDWLKAHDQVLGKIFSADPALSEDIRLAARANIAYVKGRICLSAGDETEALKWFRAAASLRRGHARARLYCWLLEFPYIRSLLPGRIARRLRFPESKE